jgi:hypothetical protein
VPFNALPLLFLLLYLKVSDTTVFYVRDRSAAESSTVDESGVLGIGKALPAKPHHPNTPLGSGFRSETSGSTRMRRLTFGRRIVLLTVVVLASFISVLPADARQRRTSRRAKATAKQPAGVPASYRSKNFLIHTDLSAKEAKDLLARMEKMVALISRYWGRRNPRPIECWVAKDLRKWPDATVQRMDPAGVEKIRGGAGVTVSAILRRGAQFRATAKVYAAAEGNVVMHEAVHAFCAHTFGTTGPVWYSEGMAEMGSYWKENDSAVNCEKLVARYLRGSEPKQLSEIVDPDQQTGDSWQNYAWRWALCHLLANNPNYAPRFRPLGLGMLTQRPGYSFERVYGAMAKEINFEYHFFLARLEPGFRADLCGWDWKAKYRQPIGPAAIASTIEAGKGWQPSRLLVKSGKTYEYSAAGAWTLSKNGKPLSADGDLAGNGRLIGILFDDYKLGKPFDLGAYGKFTAPSDGQLLLRCKSKWTELADNKGKMLVKLKFHGKGNPLPKPKVESPPPPKPSPRNPGR